jgi:hypothetical protein
MGVRSSMALPSTVVGKDAPRLFRREFVPGPGLHLVEAKPVQERFDEAAQTLVGNDARGAKPAVPGAAQRAQPMEGHGGLPTACLAENEDGLALRQLDDGALAGVELDVDRRCRARALAVRPRQQPRKLRRLLGTPFAAHLCQRPAGPRDLDELTLLETDEVSLQDGPLELAVAEIDLVLLAFRPGEEHFRERRRAPVQDRDPAAAAKDAAEEHVALPPVGVAELHVRRIGSAAVGQQRAGASKEVELLFEPHHREELYFTPR